VTVLFKCFALFESLLCSSLLTPAQGTQATYAKVPDDVKEDWKDGVEFMGVHEPFSLLAQELTHIQFCCVCDKGGDTTFCNHCPRPWCSKCIPGVSLPHGAKFICPTCWGKLAMCSDLPYLVSVSLFV
jgi:hypothetical protein